MWPQFWRKHVETWTHLPVCYKSFLHRTTTVAIPIEALAWPFPCSTPLLIWNVWIWIWTSKPAAWPPCGRACARGPYSIRQISRYALDIAPLDEGPPTSLSKELKQLSLSEDFYDILLESFSDFSYQISALCSLIRPVAEKLTKLLEPYVARAMPLADSWEQLLQHNGVEALLQSRGATFLERPLSRAWFALRYFDCWQGNGQIRTETNELFMLLGEGLEPSLIPAPKKDELSEVEFAAFRLLGDKVRSKIIQALNTTHVLQELTYLPESGYGFPST